LLFHLNDLGGSNQIKHHHFPWQGASFEEALKESLSSRTPQNLKAFPLIVT
jgi:hypothetical protein